MALLCALSPFASSSTSNADGASTDLSVSLAASAGPLRPGQAVTYTLVAANGGALGVQGAHVQDTVPSILAGVTWTCAATPGSSCLANGSGSVDQNVDLAAGGAATFTIAGTLPLDVGGMELLINGATITPPAGISDTNPANNIAATFSSIDIVVKLAITNTAAPATYVRGGTIDYTIVVTNQGPDFATGVMLEDILPANTTFVSITAPPAFSCGTQPLGGRIFCGATVSLPVSSNTFVLRVNVGPGASGTISDFVIMSYGGISIETVAAVDLAGANPDAVPGASSPAWLLLALAVLLAGAVATRRMG